MINEYKESKILIIISIFFIPVLYGRIMFIWFFINFLCSRIYVGDDEVSVKSIFYRAKIPIYNILNIEKKQGFLGNFFKVGKIKIQTMDRSYDMKNMKYPDKIIDDIQYRIKKNYQYI